MDGLKLKSWVEAIAAFVIVLVLAAAYLLGIEGDKEILYLFGLIVAAYFGFSFLEHRNRANGG